MPDGIISEENNQVTYQLPGNIKLSSEIKDGVVKSGDLTVGTYTIDENGLVTITYRTDMSNFNPSKKFPGTLIFNCSANANKKQEEDSISFDGSGTTIKVVPARMHLILMQPKQVVLTILQQIKYIIQLRYLL